MRKTKIICTLGPATNEDRVLKQLMLEGMNVARINFSHGTMEEHLETINRVKKMREELNLPVAVLLDTSGPEIRLGNFEQEKVTLEQGKEFVLTAKDVVGTKDMVSITYKKLMQDVKEGMKILLDDGLIEMSVLKVSFQTCGHKMLNLRKSLKKRAERGTYTCACCGEQFLPIRADARYCSNGCRQKGYRQRKANAG